MAQHIAFSCTENKRQLSARIELGVLFYARKGTIEMALKWHYAMLYKGAFYHRAFSPRAFFLCHFSSCLFSGPFLTSAFSHPAFSPPCRFFVPVLCIFSCLSPSSIKISKDLVTPKAMTKNHTNH
jgi:hypothetical protein